MTDKVNKTNNKFIKLNNVRLSFPSLFTKKVWPNATRPPRYEATFILDKVKHAAELKILNARIDEILAEAKSSRAKIKFDNLCLRDGNLTGREEYQDVYTLKATSARRFPIINKDAVTPVTESDNLFYGGCYVSTHIDLWLYDKPNLGISATIKSIQFRSEGEPFSGADDYDIEGAYDAVTDEEDSYPDVPGF